MSLPEFISDRIAAEVRQQMEGVLALTGQLARQRLTPDGEACVASVTEAAEGLLRIMTAAADLRATINPGPRTVPEPVVLREVMDEVQQRWEPRAAEAGVTLLVSFSGEPEAAALADRRRLIQIFDGFIGEAVGAQGRGAVEAGLSAFAGPDGVVLEGRVRGPRDTGWDDRDVEARVRSIDERLGLEVALGALLARSALDEMGGELHREANAGASDTAAFTLRLDTVPESTPTAAGPTEDAGRAAHILVVDDNATNRMVAQSLVEMFDCTSEAAEDGEEAVEAARSGRFDLILMDIRMPRMDGVAATRAIRALPGRIGATPIIALTANADPEDAEAYLAAGMNGVVEKPMKPEHLLQALQAALDPGGAAAAA
ncbi:response regulator [Phenylobacterium sp. SCN 70-31]|uniref:response regulator n=1 Tax=Phenylobacterium sp. SCN 70-31 TaxID=1660129 RepID=UPI000AD3688D|nr:response regulator [Phenylobacterium sp. SCN 70-31]